MLDPLESLIRYLFDHRCAPYRVTPQGLTYLVPAVAPRSWGGRLLEPCLLLSLLVYVCDSPGARRSVAERERKGPRRQPSAQVAIGCHISAPVWWVLRAVASQVAGPGGHDADAPVDVAIELCASSDAYIDG